MNAILNPISPKSGEVVSLITDIQRSFLEADRSNLSCDSVHWLDLHKTGVDHTKPSPVKFTWEADRIAKLHISESKDFDEEIVIRADKTATVYNLKIGTVYYWKLSCYKQQSEVFWFKTENASPRFIKIEGNTNVRDLGGWQTPNGNTVKQGMIYRGSELNSHLDITKKGLHTLRAKLNIKSVLDLRGETEMVRDVYGEGYLNVPIKAYSDFFSDNPQKLKTIFNFLTNKDNYPIFMHCWGGADRTGTLAILINALMGVSDRDLITDYEVTSLSIWGPRSRNSENFQDMLYVLSKYKGLSFAEKCEDFCLKSGISKHEIAILRGILK